MRSLVLFTLILCACNAAVLPTKWQLEWSGYEVGAMISFGMETSAFNVSDLGFCSFHTGNNGTWFPDVNHFNPEFLDTDQWAEAINNFGAKYAILTAKHCSGFAIYPTQVEGYNYSIQYSKWQNGTGDLLAQFIKSLSKYSIKIGIYYNVPINLYLNVLNYQVGAWNKTQIRPGQWNVTREQYDSIVQQQLKELWTKYGDLAEVWFDGGTTVPGVVDLLTKYQPQAIAFQGPTTFPNNIRWVGNEMANPVYPCWSTVANSTTSGGGDPNATTWAPAESDTTIRNYDHWFWTPDYFQAGLKTVGQLLSAYESAVGRNTNFMLNLSPDPYGLVPLEDMKTYQQLGAAIKACYGKSIAETQGTANKIVLDLGRNATLNRLVIQEDQTFGQRVRVYNIYSSSDSLKWDKVSNGTSIGNKRIEVLKQNVLTRFLLLELEISTEIPIISFFGAYLCKTID